MTRRTQGIDLSKLLEEIKGLTSNLILTRLEERRISLPDEFCAVAKRSSELMLQLISEVRTLSETTENAFRKFLEDPCLKNLENCFSIWAVKGVFQNKTVQDTELRRLLRRMSMIISELRKVQKFIDLFEEKMVLMEKMQK